VIDGPFPETKELVAGFQMWDVATLDEAVEWVKKYPLQDCEVELRPLYSLEELEVWDKG
jgi:hypothetical protein